MLVISWKDYWLEIQINDWELMELKKLKDTLSLLNISILNFYYKRRFNPLSSLVWWVFSIQLSCIKMIYSFHVLLLDICYRLLQLRYWIHIGSTYRFSSREFEPVPNSTGPLPRIYVSTWSRAPWRECAKQWHDVAKRGNGTLQRPSMVLLLYFCILCSSTSLRHFLHLLPFFTSTVPSFFLSFPLRASTRSRITFTSAITEIQEGGLRCYLRRPLIHCEWCCLHSISFLSVSGFYLIPIIYSFQQSMHAAMNIE